MNIIEQLNTKYHDILNCNINREDIFDIVLQEGQIVSNTNDAFILTNPQIDAFKDLKLKGELKNSAYILRIALDWNLLNKLHNNETFGIIFLSSLKYEMLKEASKYIPKELDWNKLKTPPTLRRPGKESIFFRELSNSLGGELRLFMDIGE